jgi:hypothetical protein
MGTEGKAMLSNPKYRANLEYRGDPNAPQNLELALETCPSNIRAHVMENVERRAQQRRNRSANFIKKITAPVPAPVSTPGLREELQAHLAEVLSL